MKDGEFQQIHVNFEKQKKFWNTVGFTQKDW